MMQIACPACHRQITIDTTALPAKPVVLPCPECNTKLLFHRNYPNETRISRSSETPAVDVGEMRHRQEILRGQLPSGAFEEQSQSAIVQLLLDIRKQNANNAESLSDVLAELRRIRFIMENFKISEHR
jgi:predicted Zn finger-like uncharacterized protein